MAKLTEQLTLNDGEVMGKEEWSLTAGGIQTGGTTLEISTENPQETKIKTTI